MMKIKSDRVCEFELLRSILQLRGGGNGVVNGFKFKRVKIIFL